jgi:tRNA (guanine-N7-)-methyltransferase
MGGLAAVHARTVADWTSRGQARPFGSLRGTSLSMPRPYHDAPRLPEGERIELGSLVRGDWVEVELGPGRGWFLVERAEVEPGAALIGLEIRRKWASIVDGRLSAKGFGARARVFAEDARFALPRLGPDQTVRRFFVHFPDPWWKKRHAKRLLVQAGFLDEIARLLEPHGELFVQTDVEERAAGYEELAAFDGRFLPHGDAAGSPRLAENPYAARSSRERRAITDGLPVHRLRWKRRP